MRGLKQRSMPAVDDFVATCSVCGAALRPVHVLRGDGRSPVQLLRIALIVAADGPGTRARSGPPRPKTILRSVCSRTSSVPAVSRVARSIAVWRSRC